MQNQLIQLIPADLSLAEQVVDYYQRNRKFLEKFEPVRTEDFFRLPINEKCCKKKWRIAKKKQHFVFILNW